MNLPPSTLPRIVIIGGGAGGLELATRLGHRLGRKQAQILLVDRNPSHLWKPRLHEVAAGLIGSGDDETNYLAHGCVHGFDFALGNLLSIDSVGKTVTLDRVLSSADDTEVLGERTLPYDMLVLALGSRVNDFGIPGVLEYCHMLDSPAQALKLQRAFLESAIQVGAGRLDRVRVGIVGAGATGVELAAELYHAVHAMERWGGLGASGKLDITLVDMASRILPAIDPKTSRHATKVLEKLGVRILLGESVEQVTADALHLKSGATVPCEIKVWASGVSKGGAAGEFPMFRYSQSIFPANGSLAKVLYVSLYHMHRVALHGWLRAAALFLADRLRRTTLPPVKLH